MVCIGIFDPSGIDFRERNVGIRLDSTPSISKEGFDCSLCILLADSQHCVHQNQKSHIGGTQLLRILYIYNVFYHLT